MPRLEPEDENLLRDGLTFKRELDNPSSSLSCLRQGLYVLREIWIEKAKMAHSKKAEERAAYYMGVVEGIDLAIGHPKVMLRKWEVLAQREMARATNSGVEDGE